MGRGSADLTVLAFACVGQSSQDHGSFNGIGVRLCLTLFAGSFCTLRYWRLLVFDSLRKIMFHLIVLAFDSLRRIILHLTVLAFACVWQSSLDHVSFSGIGVRLCLTAFARSCLI